MTRQTTTAKMPKKTSAKVSDPDDFAWTEDMRGASVLKRGWGPQAAPAEVLTSARTADESGFLPPTSSKAGPLT